VGKELKFGPQPPTIPYVF